MNATDWPAIVAAMRAGGFYARIMDGGPEFDRVKDYLRAFAGERDRGAGDARMNPKYPCFRGLRNRPFHEARDFPQAATLAHSYPAIRAEVSALGSADELDYTIASTPLRNWRRPWSYLRRRAPPRAWTVYPFWYMGVRVEDVTRRCPQTMAVIASLPGLCVDYPWGDAVFSVQGPHSSLRPHCSVDNLRVRCHLALRIPAGTGIRVDTESRRWTEGECLLFEDAFEHEVWNRSAHRRLVLIVDFWHPDLTPIEREALMAGFAKREVREIFMRQRIDMTDSPGTYVPHLRATIAEQEDRAVVRAYWNR